MLLLQIELIRRDYVANGGWETFLSYEDPEQDIFFPISIFSYDYVLTIFSRCGKLRSFVYEHMCF